MQSKQRLLLLYGVCCTKSVWKDLAPCFADYDLDVVEYPREVTLRATRVEDLTRWVFENYNKIAYDAIVGHSLGGIIALQLVADFNMPVDRIFLLDTNLKPAEAFYRNLMIPNHLKQYGDSVLPMLKAEAAHYTPELFQAIQGEFDYTGLALRAKQKVFALYGDRDQPGYERRASDLNLPDEVLAKLNFRWIEHACHMIMMENSIGFAEVIKRELQVK